MLLNQIRRGGLIIMKQKNKINIGYQSPNGIISDRMDKLELTPGIVIGTVARDIDRRFLLSFMDLRRPLPKIPIIIDSLIVKRRRDEIILSKGEQIRTQNRDMLEGRENMLRSLYEEASNVLPFSSFRIQSNSLDPEVRSLLRQNRVNTQLADWQRRDLEAILEGGNYPDCCDNIDNHNYCIRISDNKKFKLPRKFKKRRLSKR